MTTFLDLNRHLGRVPANIVRVLGGIDTFRGREDVFRHQHPQMLGALTEVARIQSTEASNAIEGIYASPKRIAALVADKTTPRTRSETEIAGYRYVLDLIHASAPDVAFTVNVVKQLHQNMYRYTKERNVGRFKMTDNTVEEVLPDGSTRIRMRTVPSWDTERYMGELHNRFSAAWNADEHHRLLLVAAYVFDFTVIHPFQDGNGRMSRLLTLLLLYHAGYDVGRFISLEKLIDESRETYYEALARSTTGWHEGEHNLYPWVEYFVGILVAAYKEFEARLGVVSGPGAKSAAVKQFIRSSFSDEFTFDDIRNAAPGVSDSTIKNVLSELKSDSVVEALSTGRGARWRRIKGDF